MTKSVLLVGVGGQGTILASKLLTLGLMEEGYLMNVEDVVSHFHTFCNAVLLELLRKLLNGLLHVVIQ